MERRERVRLNGRCAVAVLLLVGSGCLQHPGPTVPGTAQSVPHDVPPPGRFPEHAQEIAALRGLLLNASADESTLCASDGIRAMVHDQVDRESYLEALQALISSCSAPGARGVRQMSEDAMANGTERAAFEALRRPAWDAQNASSALLDALEPRSMLQAEVLALLGLMDDFHRSALALADEDFARFQTDRRSIVLGDALLNLLATRIEANATVRFIHRFQAIAWPCAVEPPPAPVDEAWRLYNDTLRLAERKGDPSDRQWVDTMYGHLVKVTGPALERDGGLNRTASILGLLADLSWDHGYWERVGTRDLPDREEARSQIAAFRNTTRTLFTDYRIQGVAGAAEDAGPTWDDVAATRVMALTGFQSPFERYSC